MSEEEKKEFEARRKRKMAIFVHEYLHYLHNFSTLAGIYELIAQFRLTHSYRAAVGVSGRCHGDAALGGDDIQRYQAVLNWTHHLRGDYGLRWSEITHRGDVKIRVLNLENKESTIDIAGGPLAAVGVDVTFEMTSERSEPSTHRMMLGTSILTEAIAIEIDQSIQGIAPGVSCDDPMEVVPYRVARAIFEYVVGSVPDRRVLVKACLLALQSPDPGDSYREILRELAKARLAGKDIALRLEEFAVTMQTDLTHHLAEYEQMLGREFGELQEKIPYLASAIAFMRSQSVGFVALRTRSPFFELEFIRDDFTKDDLTRLIYTHSSCPMVEVGNSATDGRFRALRAPGPSEEEVQSLGMLQGFLQVGASHFRTGSLLPTESIRKEKCLMFSACRAPATTRADAPCTTTPWRTFVYPPPPEGLCWYGAGVAATRGRGDLA